MGCGRELETPPHTHKEKMEIHLTRPMKTWALIAMVTVLLISLVQRLAVK